MEAIATEKQSIVGKDEILSILNREQSKTVEKLVDSINDAFIIVLPYQQDGDSKFYSVNCPENKNSI
jgi:hypothetical protein